MTRKPAAKKDPVSDRQANRVDSPVSATARAVQPVEATATRLGSLLRLYPRLLGTLLFVFVLAVFLPVLRHEFISYDDNGYVTANPHVQSGLNWANVNWAFRSAEMANWHPLTWISHLIDVELFGKKSWGHHLTSVLLHATNALLVFVVMRKMTGAVWRSWFVAALFGLHPLHVESVAWVAERKDVLSTLFWLLTLWCYAEWTVRKSASRPRAAVFYGLTLLFFAFGLMSKPMVVTLPCVMMLLDYWPLNRWGAPTTGRVRLVVFWQLLVEKLPFVALSIGSCAITVIAQSDAGAISTWQRLSWTVRVINAFVSYAGYLGKSFYPVNLAVFYPYPEKLYGESAALAGALLVGVTLVAMSMRWTRPYLIVGWLFFLGTLVPVIGLVQVGDQSMADRYTYVPLLGIFILLVWGLADLSRAWSNRCEAAVGLATVPLLMILTLLTNRQLNYWQNSETLSRRALAVTERNWSAHLILGYTLAQDPARQEEALAEYRSAVKFAPNSAEAHYSLGAVLVRKPDGLAEALAEYQTALRIKPDYAQAHLALGKAQRQFPERLTDAVAHLEVAARLTRDDSDVHYELAEALAQIPDRISDAISEYRTVVHLRPDLIEVHSNLGILLAQLPGRLPEAIEEYAIVIRAKPDFAEAHNNLANALAQSPGRSDEAISEYEKALRFRPDYDEAEFNFGLFLSGLPGRDPEAIAHFEAALKIKPDLDPARMMLERLRSRSRR